MRLGAKQLWIAKRETGGLKEREGGGWMQYFMKKEDKSLIDVYNITLTIAY